MKIIEIFNFNHFCYSFNPFLSFSSDTIKPPPPVVTSAAQLPKWAECCDTENETKRESKPRPHCNADADFRRQGARTRPAVIPFHFRATVVLSVDTQSKHSNDDVTGPLSDLLFVAVGRINCGRSDQIGFHVQLLIWRPSPADNDKSNGQLWLAGSVV